MPVRSDLPARAASRALARALAGGCAALMAAAVQAASPPPVVNSILDGELFYQLLIGETELRRGDNQAAYQRLLDAARRSRDERLFQRAVEVAASARAPDLAVTAVRLWRSTLPRSARACEFQAQLYTSLGKVPEAAEPMRCFLERTPASERPAAIAALPRLVARGTEAKAAAAAIEDVIKPYRDQADTRVPALVTAARVRLIAGDGAAALGLVREAQATDAKAPGPALLALELMGTRPEAEDVVKRYLASGESSGAVRMIYARRLTAAQRLGDAVRELQVLTRQDPKVPAGWLTLGALHLELQQPAEAEQALNRYLEVSDAADNAPPAVAASGAADAAASGAEPRAAEEEADERAEANAQERAQAYLLLAQAAEQQKKFGPAAEWLERAQAIGGSPTVVARRASLLARQGKVDEARALVRSLPDRTPEEARTRALTESQVLRDAQRWRDAHGVLVAANERFPDDPDMLYEQAMMAEKLDRMDEMEGVLRRVMQLRPDHQHAYNALGYSLADRNRRLPEARQLIAKALELAPGDPFITDSLAWVEYRMGNRAEALRLLREAYAKRPDTEIAAHLGEVLWVDGQQDEARRIWREGQSRDSDNPVLKETLGRLKVRL
jgi:tetratricopeptide (TPR) repeat protein